MWLELESVSEISSPRWSSVYECQSVECAFTSPVIIELGMLVMYCMQFVMSVSGQVGLGVGSWPSNRATEGSNPKGTRLYLVILLKNVGKIFDWQ